MWGPDGNVIEDVADLWCNPNNPWYLDYASIVKAEERLKPYGFKTNCLASHYQKEFTMSMYYKLESWHKCGSFKERGTVNCLLQLPKQNHIKRGIIIASLGNEAIAMGMSGAKLGVSITAVIPTCVQLSVKQRICELGVNVIVFGETLHQAQRYARYLSKENCLIYINSRDQPYLLEGYGTIALEILRDLPYVDAIIVPVGAGGLAAAIATVVKHDKPQCLVYGVQPEAACPLKQYKTHQEFRYQQLQHIQERENDNAEVDELEELREALIEIPEEFPLNPTLANSINVSQVGVNAVANVIPLLDRLIHVKEESIAKALLHIMDVEHLVVEGAAACTLAAIMENLVPELKTKTVVCILTGGNVDPTVYVRSLHRGMSADCCYIKFNVMLNNSTKDIARLEKLLALSGYYIVQQNECFRWLESDTCRVELEIVCQARSPEHGLELKKIMEKAYPYTAVFATSPFNIHPKCLCYKPQKRLI